MTETREPCADNPVQITGGTGLLYERFTQVSNELLHDTTVSPDARFLYCLLAFHINNERRKDGDTEVWPSQKTLGAQIGKAPRTVRGYLRELEQAGWITTIQRGDKQTNIYAVHGTPQESDRQPIAGRDQQPTAAPDRQPTASELYESELDESQITPPISSGEPTDTPLHLRGPGDPVIQDDKPKQTPLEIAICKALGVGPLTEKQREKLTLPVMAVPEAGKVPIAYPSPEELFKTEELFRELVEYWCTFATQENRIKGKRTWGKARLIGAIRGYDWKGEHSWMAYLKRPKKSGPYVEPKTTPWVPVDD